MRRDVSDWRYARVAVARLCLGCMSCRSPPVASRLLSAYGRSPWVALERPPPGGLAFFDLLFISLLRKTNPTEWVIFSIDEQTL